MTVIGRFEPDQPGHPPGVIWLNSANDVILYYRTEWTGSKLLLIPSGQVQGIVGSGLRLSATGDFDNDLQDDLLLERISDSMALLCLMDGLTARTPCLRLGVDIFHSDDPMHVLPHSVVGPR
jgi:hypothetical protein